MKFNLYNSQLDIVDTGEAEDIDIATERFFIDSDIDEMDAISDHITIVIDGRFKVWAVAEDGYVPEKEDMN